MESGSALLFALFACLVAAACIQGLAAAVVCGERAVADESAGRRWLAGVDACLVALRDRAVERWEPLGSTDMEVAEGTLACSLVGSEEADWVLHAEVEGAPFVPGGVVRTLVERGRDGLDLPRGALVAGCVRVGSERPLPWLSGGWNAAGGNEDDEAQPQVPIGSGTTAYVGRVDGAVVIAGGCDLRYLESTWDLDDGWRCLLDSYGTADARTFALNGRKGQLISLPDGIDASSARTAAVVVVLGGADLDLRGLGDFWGVVVVDSGSVLLEETTVHGAVYASESVDVGVAGGVVFEQEVWQWARDGSITRVRLVPGSRREDTE